MRLFTKIFIILFIAITVSISIYSYSIISIKKIDLEKELNLKIDNNKKLYKESISALLYEFNSEVLSLLLNSLYLDNEIVKIELYDSANSINISLNNKKFKKKNLILSSIDLVYNNEKIGKLNIYYTKKYIIELLNQYKYTISSFSLFIFIIIILFLFFVVKKFAKSIEYLSEATKQISHGDFSKKIELDTDDEIGDLAKKFEKMRISLIQRDELNTKQREKIIALNEEMLKTQKKLIEILGEVIEKRYVDDPHHIKRVAQISYILALKAGEDEEYAQTLKMVSPIHDVGKVGISDAILLKPGKLTLEEYEEMKKHAEIGYNFLKNTGKKTLDMAAEVAHEHHERWDGKGYPRGIKEEEISLHGRITAIADVFDALTNKRCYKDAWKIEKAKEYIIKNRGVMFDPKLVDIFIENFKEISEINIYNIIDIS